MASSSSFEHLQCEMFCYNLNATRLFNCNAIGLCQTYNSTGSYVSVFLYGVFSVKLWVQMLLIVLLLYDVWIWYRDWNIIRKNLWLPVWRRNLYLCMKTFRIMWEHKFRPKLLLSELWKLQMSSFRQSFETLPLHGMFLGECINKCGNKTSNKECFTCEYHNHYHHGKLLPIQREVIYTVLGMQKRAGSVWSILSPDLTRWFCQEYLIKKEQKVEVYSFFNSSIIF